jgi:hypothetical protein
MADQAAMSASSRARIVPWIEGGVLALCVLAILALGGEAVRASYHGYLHVAVGEAVVRDGLRPENPYHAGSPLRYYTLYPWLGVMIGRVGGDVAGLRAAQRRVRAARAGAHFRRARARNSVSRFAARRGVPRGRARLQRPRLRPRAHGTGSSASRRCTRSCR